MCAYNTHTYLHIVHIYMQHTHAQIHITHINKAHTHAYNTHIYTCNAHIYMYITHTHAHPKAKPEQSYFNLRLTLGISAGFTMRVAVRQGVHSLKLFSREVGMSVWWAGQAQLCEGVPILAEKELTPFQMHRTFCWSLFCLFKSL